MDRRRSGMTRCWLAAGTAVAMALLAACGDDSSAEPAVLVATTRIPAVSTPLSPVTDTVTTEMTEMTAEGDFPVTVSGADGDVTIEERPERIVVLSSTLTETVFAVGAGEQVIAVDSYSNHPADAPITQLSAFKPNIEAIGAFQPDLVLLARDRDDLVATLDAVGIQSLVLPSAADLAEVYAQVETVGAATGHTEDADTLSATMRASIDEQFRRLDDVTVPTDYFYELSNEYHSSTSATFVGSILDELGMVNIADGVDAAAGPYPQLSAEFVLDSDPAQIFVAHTDGSTPMIEEIATRPGWATLRAVTDGNIVVLDPDIASRWGPRVVDLVIAIADGLTDRS